jgi:hypothetical protein
MGSSQSAAHAALDRDLVAAINSFGNLLFDRLRIEVGPDCLLAGLPSLCLLGLLAGTGW